MVWKFTKMGEVMAARVEQPGLRPLPAVPGGEVVNLIGWPVDWRGALRLPKRRGTIERFLRFLLRLS